MAASNTLRGNTLRGKTLILAPKGNSLAPAVLPIKSAGDVTLALTNVSSTGSVGTLSVTLQAALTNNLATGALGSVVASSGSPDVTVAATGVQSTGAVGSVAVSISKALTNNASTGAVGSISPQISKVVTNNSTTGTVNTVTAGISRALTGNLGTGAAGSVSIGLSASLTNNLATGQTGAIGVQSVVGISGAQASGVAGSLTVSLGGDVTVGISGVAGTSAVNGFPYGAYVEPGYGDPDYYEHMGVNFRLPASGVSGSGAVGSMVATVFDDVVLTLTAQQAIYLTAVCRLHGLIDPLVVSPTARGDGVINQTLTGTGPVTVATTALPANGLLLNPALIMKLARWYGILDPMVEQDASRSDGTLSQSVITVSDATTMTTL